MQCVTVTLLLPLLILWGCTLCFQNIDTHGTATDLIDETQDTRPNISPTVTVPLPAKVF